MCILPARSIPSRKAPSAAAPLVLHWHTLLLAWLGPLVCFRRLLFPPCPALLLFAFYIPNAAISVMRYIAVTQVQATGRSHLSIA